MEIKKEKNNNTLIVYLNGRLDSSNALDIETDVLDELDDINNLTFNFKDLKYTSSAGLRIFLKAQKIMSLKGGSMQIINMSDEIYEIFEMTGFSEIMDIFRNEK